MKFSTVIISLGFAALAAAQAANSTHAVTTPPVPTQTDSPITKCLKKCNPSDAANYATCQAQCIGSAAPNDGAANATNQCVAECPKGNGSQAGTDQYTQCRNDCISKIFLSTSVAPATTGSSGSGSGLASGSGAGSTTSNRGNAANPTSSGKPSSSGTSTGSGSAPNAGSSVQVGGFILLLGMAAGVLAL